jgi:hypothetical protein
VASRHATLEVMPPQIQVKVDLRAAYSRGPAVLLYSTKYFDVEVLMMNSGAKAPTARSWPRRLY